MQAPKQLFLWIQELHYLQKRQKDDKLTTQELYRLEDLQKKLGLNIQKRPKPRPKPRRRISKLPPPSTQSIKGRPRSLPQPSPIEYQPTRKAPPTRRIRAPQSAPVIQTQAPERRPSRYIVDQLKSAKGLPDTFTADTYQDLPAVPPSPPPIQSDIYDRVDSDEYESTREEAFGPDEEDIQKFDAHHALYPPEWLDS